VDADEVFTTEFTSPATANILTHREFIITTSGQIASTTPAQGDTINVVLKRIAASGSEDGNSIKLGPVVVSVIPGTLALTSYVGRVGAIVDDVLDMFNDRREEWVTEADALRWINKCTLEIASRGYFKTSDLVDLTSGDGDIDLSTVFSDHSEILSLYWEATGEEITPLSTIVALQANRQACPSGTVTLGYYIQSNILYLVPTPSVSATGAIRVWRNQIPLPMTGLFGSCTPPVPEDRDKVYFYFCMQRAHMKDRHNSDSATNVAMYNGLFEKEMNGLMSQNTTPNFQLRPYR
jgi:hypothetical protein